MNVICVTNPNHRKYSISINCHFFERCKNFLKVFLGFISNKFELLLHIQIKKQAENGLQSRSSENGKTAVWHYELKLQ